MSGVRESSSLVQWMKSLLNEKRHADVMFEISPTEKVYAHKIVLEGASPVFGELFKRGQGKTQIISITDCGREAVMNMLRFVHSYEINLQNSDIETVFETLRLARKYKLKDGLTLENACKDRLKSVDVSVKNVCALLQNAIGDSNGGDFVAKCWSLVDREAPKVFKTASFKRIELSLLEQVLGRDSLQCKEIEVFDAAIAWAKEKCRSLGRNPNPKLLRQQLGSAFLKIRFPLMSVMEFEDGPEKVISLTDCETKILYKYYVHREQKRVDQSCTPQPFSSTPRGMLGVGEENGMDRTEPSNVSVTLTPMEATPTSSSSCMSNGASRDTRSSLRTTSPQKKRKEIPSCSSPSRRSKRNCQIPGLVSQVNTPPPEWFSEKHPQRSPYFPQIGDEVVYYRQGHKCYADAAGKKKKVYSISKSMRKEFPYVRFPDLPATVVARVQEIDFVLEPYRLICVHLEEVDIENNSLPGRKFKVYYHDMDDEVDFLILRQVHDECCAVDWRPEDKFRCLVDKDWLCGHVDAEVPIDESSLFENSKFLCYQVTYTNFKTSSLSPWDMERIPESFKNRRKEKDGSVAATDDELKTYAHYTPTVADWQPYARDSMCAQLSTLILQVMLLPAANNFCDPVDLTNYPQYSQCIAYPMDLSLIRHRLNNLFYRRIDALKFDLEFLVVNAKKYKPGDVEYIKNAKITRDLCLKLIEKPNTPPKKVLSLYNDLVAEANNDSPQAGPSLKRTSSCSSISSSSSSDLFYVASPRKVESN